MPEPVDEVWVGLDELPNYSVSNYGRVVNNTTGRDLKPSPDGNGYLRVCLFHKGIRHWVYVHRLVAKVFFLNYKEGIEVKHKNKDLKDNSVLNLTLGQGCRVAPGKREKDDVWKAKEEARRKKAGFTDRDIRLEERISSIVDERKVDESRVDGAYRTEVHSGVSGDGRTSEDGSLEARRGNPEAGRRASIIAERSKIESRLTPSQV